MPRKSKHLIWKASATVTCMGKVDGTTRATWHASLILRSMGPGEEEVHIADGQGKAPHVALNEATRDAFHKAGL